MVKLKAEKTDDTLAVNNRKRRLCPRGSRRFLLLTASAVKRVASTHD